MHEVSLAQGVVSAVTHAANGRPVRTVCVRIGAAAGVVREAFETAWIVATTDTPLDGAALEIDWVPATVWCDACKADQPIDEFWALACPVCDAITPAMPKGKEFEVAWVDVGS